MRALLVLPVALMLGSCTNAASVRDGILGANSPLVDGAYSSEGSIWSRPEVFVGLVPTTTVTEAEQFWCEVVVPAGGTHELVRVGIQGKAGDVATDTTCLAGP